MALKLTDAGAQTAQLNRWADGVERDLAEIRSQVKKATIIAVANSDGTATAETAKMALAGSPVGVQATESGKTIDGVLYSQVTFTYFPPNPVGTFGGVYVVAQGYLGSTELVKVWEHQWHGTANVAANFNIILNRTNETVTFYLVPVNKENVTPKDWSTAPSVQVTLDGNASAPNPPTGLSGSQQPLGVLLTWTENAEDNLIGYNVYRGTTNDFASATKVSTVATTHGGAPSYYDQNETIGTTYYFWVTAVNSVKQESGASTGIYGTAGSFNSSTILNGQGSILPNQLIVVPYTYTSTSITFTWSQQSMLRADGSYLTIPSGTKTYSSLTASTTYYCYAYVDAVTGILNWTNPTPPQTSPSSLYAAQTALDGRIPIDTFKITTASSGNTGGGTGGGGDTCPEFAELVDVKDKGLIPAGEVEVGDFVLGYCFETQMDGYRQVVAKSLEPCAAWRIIDGHRVSPCEQVWKDAWLPAFKVPGATFDAFQGFKVNLTVESDTFDQSNYYLTSGTRLLIHNVGATRVSPC